MGMLQWLVKWVMIVAALALAGAGSGAGEVTYDRRSLIINGERKLLFSGSIHYPRSTPDVRVSCFLGSLGSTTPDHACGRNEMDASGVEVPGPHHYLSMWAALIGKAKAGGLNTIDTYVFWNVHEPKPGQYYFSGRADLVKFIKEVHSQGLYVCLRIGPFIQGEWTYGGLPMWLRDIPGIVFRTDNEPFKFYMQNFTTMIVNLMKSEKLFAWQGGPIVLSQIENEYQNVQKAFDAAGARYVLWAAKMAISLDTGVPWVMCKQDDAPGPVINACNGRQCAETFIGPNSPNKPAIWTENWTHLYDLYGNATRIYRPQFIAFQVALFIVRMQGSFINYYMYHGGTNFGRTTSTFTLTSYYDPAPLDEYGLINEPKWVHLRDLHLAVQSISSILLYGRQTNHSLGSLLEAYVYSGDNGECAAFLVNTGDINAGVQFLNQTYQLPKTSISILPDCKTVTFNTAKVATPCTERKRVPYVKLDSPTIWKEWREVIPVFDNTSLKSDLLLEQMNTTKDTSDYLWYTAKYEVSNVSKAEISINSLGHVLRAYVNGQHIGSGHGYFRNLSFTLNTTILFNSGANDISLLSVMVGTPDSGAHLEKRAAGLSNVSIQDNVAKKDLSENYAWGYQIGLLGEGSQIYSIGGSSRAPWGTFNLTLTPLTWFKTNFDAPPGSDPVVLDLSSMGKGEAWINGQSIGRYWVSFLKPDGLPSQTWFHIPRSFLKATGNLLVLFEEEKGNPLGISVGTVYLSNICGQQQTIPNTHRVHRMQSAVKRSLLQA